MNSVYVEVRFMQLELSHDLPDGSMPLSAMKEELSVAYIHMLASSTGLVIADWNQDYSACDRTLSSQVKYPGGYAKPKIDVQLKCTSQARVSGSKTVNWPLDRRSHELLSDRERFYPTMLCVLVTKPEPGHWLHFDQAGLLARSTMYWWWGQNLAPLQDGDESMTVNIPYKNTLTPRSLLERMKEASIWQPG